MTESEIGHTMSPQLPSPRRKAGVHLRPGYRLEFILGRAQRGPVGRYDE